MTSKTWPFPEGVPEKYAGIERDPIADAEWDRICDALAARRMLSPAWGGLILIASAALSGMRKLESLMEAHGRTEEFAESHATCVNQYRAACRDLTVEPHSSVTLAYVKGDYA